MTPQATPIRIPLFRRRSFRVTVIIAFVIAVLAALAVHRAVITLRAVKSASNLREISGYITIYANDHSGHFPDSFGDLALAGNDQFNPLCFIIPGGKATVASGTSRQIADELNSPKHCSYIYLGKGLTSATASDNFIIAYEADRDRPLSDPTCLFGDGHGENMSATGLIQYVVVPLMEQIKTTAAPSTTSQPTRHLQRRKSASTTRTSK